MFKPVWLSNNYCICNITDICLLFWLRVCYFSLNYLLSMSILTGNWIFCWRLRSWWKWHGSGGGQNHSWWSWKVYYWQSRILQAWSGINMGKCASVSAFIGNTFYFLFSVYGLQFLNLLVLNFRLLLSQ